MAAITVNKSTTIGGLAFSGIQSIEEEGELSLETTPAACASGTLTTRTDNDTGVATVATGHGITTSDVVDVVWTGGKRVGCTVTATTSTTISIDAGSGDNLPVTTTALTVAKCTNLSAVLTGTNLVAIAISCQKACIVRLRGSTTDHLTVELAANGVYIWSTGNGDNPVTGDSIDTCRVSNKDSSNANRIRAGFLYAAV